MCKNVISVYSEQNLYIVPDHNRFDAKTMTSQIHLKTQNKGDTMDQF